MILQDDCAYGKKLYWPEGGFEGPVRERLDRAFQADAQAEAEFNAQGYGGDAAEFNAQQQDDYQSELGVLGF